MLVINCFSGPGAGKSTNAAALYALMKKKHMSVELVREYATELVYEERFDILKRQDKLLKEQKKRQKRLKGIFDFAITDSPILLGVPYVTKGFQTATLTEESVKQKIIDSFLKFNNFNFFLDRTDNYTEIGRIHNQEQANEIDKEIIQLLTDLKLPYHRVKVDDRCPETMLEILELNLRGN